jgi:long-chain acyl-CoA synthetase
MHLTVGLHQQLQRQPDKKAITCEGRELTFRQFVGRIAKLAGAFRGLGLDTGDRVAMLALNSERYLEYYFGVWWAGGVASPINNRWAIPEILYSLDDSQSTILVIDKNFRHLIDDLRKGASSLKQVIYIGDDTVPSGTLAYEALLQDAKPVEDAYRHGNDIAGIFYTGGTTGHPKGVMLSHTNIGVAALMKLYVGFGFGPVVLHAMPMFHGAPLFWIIGELLYGGRHVILPKFEPAAVVQAISKERVTDILLVPSMIQMMLDHPSIKSADFSSLQRVWYGASTINEATLRRAMEVFLPAKFVQVYALTEAPASAFLAPSFHTPDNPKLRSTGPSGPETQLKIVDSDGNEAPRGTVGEIMVRGMNVMLGYWNKPAETAKVLKDGWVRTGDAAYMDEDGFIYIADRVKDMIVTGGENVYAAEVENAIAKHASVAASAVIGIPSEQWGEAVHAVVVLKPGAAKFSPDELRTHCKNLIAGYKCPRSVEFRDALPMSAVGKVTKNVLREPYWKNMARKV